MVGGFLPSPQTGFTYVETETVGIPGRGLGTALDRFTTVHLALQFPGFGDIRHPRESLPSQVQHDRALWSGVRCPDTAIRVDMRPQDLMTFLCLILLTGLKRRIPFRGVVTMQPHNVQESTRHRACHRATWTHVSGPSPCCGRATQGGVLKVALPGHRCMLGAGRAGLTFSVFS